MVCIVHGYTEMVFINYYSTGDNSKLSSWELIKRCIETTFGEEANFFNNAINFKRTGAKLVITSVDDPGTGKVYYAYTFLILKIGIVRITANPSDDESAASIVAEVAESILAKDGNGFIE